MRAEVYHGENEGSPKREIELVQWPESMWPLDPSALQSIPEELLPDIDALRALRYPWEFLVLMRDTMKERITDTRGQENVVIDNPNVTTINGPVWFAEGARLRPGAEVDGPSYVAGHVGFSSLVRGSALFPGSSIGAHGEVANSLLLGGSFPHHNTILDSVIDKGVDVAGYVKTANYAGGKNITVRVPGEENPIDTGLDHLGTVIGKSSRVQADAAFNPGKFLGRGSIIEQGVRVYSHVPDGMVLSAPRVEQVLRRINP